jgi:hypothetical protein
LSDSRHLHCTNCDGCERESVFEFLADEWCDHFVSYKLFTEFVRCI